MGDSDDEYDRRGRGRDKFRRERSDYAEVRPQPVNVRRDDWSERNDAPGLPGNVSTVGGGGGWSSTTSLNRDRLPAPRRDNYGRDNYSGGMNRGYGGRTDSRYSPADRSGDMSPPSKRIRARDWDERYPNYELGGGHHSGGGGHYGSGGSHHRDSYGHDRDDEQTQPPMMTLKQFLVDQDDHIDEETLIRKYNEYKADFRKTQLQEFFNRHKDEEWFRCKYFPDEIEKRKERQASTYQKRLEVFMELFEGKWFDDVSLDVDKADQIVKVLDAVVIKLEGGSDFDLKSLEEAPEDALPKVKDSSSIFAVDSASTTKASGVVVPPKVIKLEGVPGALGPAGDANKTSTTAATDSGLEDETGEIKSEHDGEAGDGGNQDQVTNSEPKSPEVASQQQQEQQQNKPTEEGEELADGELPEEGEDDSKLTGDGEIHEPDSPDPAVRGAGNEAAAAAPPVVKPRALHKTCSIFFRNLAPSITKQEIEDECKKFPGFLRLSISEPQMDRRFNRRGWATFERTVNIREICWALNSVKIRGTEIGPIVNRDLTRRIRSVNGISSHKSVVRADIRHAAKLIMKLDEEKGLWKATTEGADATGQNGANGATATPIIAMPSRNPLLKNITDYLIEEASAEEEELLGGAVDLMDDLEGGSKMILDGDGEDSTGAANGSNGLGSGTSEGSALERDDHLIGVLDRLLFYLRIVHSTDYYSTSEYPAEDEMPNRIGLIHARGLFSSARVAPCEIADYMKEFEAKISPMLTASSVVTPEEAKKLGMKDIEEAVEAFIKENTKELGEGKWLCPLSNKKFMGPEFVRKHILNKHLERVDQVRAETHYFNNYILDPKRPMLPEHPFNCKTPGSGGSGTPNAGRSSDHRGDMHSGLAGYGDHRGYGGGGGYYRGQYAPGGRYNLHNSDYRSGMKRSRPDYTPTHSSSYHSSYQHQSSRDPILPPPPPPPAAPSVGSRLGGSGSALASGGGIAARDSVEYDVDFEEMI